MTALLAPLLLPVWLTAWHFGQLHTYEKVGALSLAFFPFVVLSLLSVVKLRRDARAEARAAAAESNQAAAEETTEDATDEPTNERRANQADQPSAR